MLRHPAAATETNLISNKYFLNVGVKTSGLTCCDTKPSISVPLTIIPLQNPAIYGFPEPPGFAPMPLGQFVVPVEFGVVAANAQPVEVE